MHPKQAKRKTSNESKLIKNNAKIKTLEKIFKKLDEIKAKQYKSFVQRQFR